MLCGYKPPETERERCIRMYETAKKVVNRIYAEKVGHNFNCMQIVLEKNYVCIVNAVGDIDYNWAKRTRSK